jgi:DNA polymerase-3 subunit beta
MSRNRKASKQSTETTTESSAPSANPAILSAITRAEFTASKKDLTAAVRRLASIAPKKPSIAVLSYMMIKAGPEGVTLAATDLDIYAVHNAPAWTVHGTGSVLVNAKALNELLRKLPDGPVTVRARELGVEVCQGTASVILQSFNARDFPKFPTVENFATVNAKPLRDVIDGVSFAVCKDQTRFHLNGVLLSHDGARFRGVATDGHRLALAQLTERDPKPTASALDLNLPSKGVIVPAQACDAIRKLLRDGECEIRFHAPYLVVRQSGVTFSCKTIDATFPPYEQVIPKANARLVTVDRAALLGALGRAALNCSGARGVELVGKDQTLTLKTANPDKGEASETLPCETRPDGVNFTIGLQAKYLIEACESISGERVTIAISGDEKMNRDSPPKPSYQLDPVLVRDAEHAATQAIMESSYLCVIMPMRI